MDFFFGLVCATFFSLANARTATTLTPTAYPLYPEFDNCGFNLNATCDDKMKLFADRNLLATSEDWKKTSVVYIPPNTGEIEIRCIDGWILGGILASSENGLITNNAWNCSSDNGTTWNNAHELGANGVTAEDISPDAKWIWTDRPTWTHTKQKRHTTAICTIQLPNKCGTTTTPCTECVPCLFSGTTPTPTLTPTTTPTPTPTIPEPTPGFNLNATCNNKMELFMDGNLRATSYNWRDTSQVHIPARTQTVEIHCSDSCWLIEGILASSDNGLITDNSWNCSSDNGITWSSAHEIVPNGLSVPDISPDAKWISTGQDTWMDGGKVICKVMLDVSAATTSTTKGIQPESTTPITTGCLYTDKYVECPEFKNQCKTGNFVDCMNRDCAKTCKCGPQCEDCSPWSSWSSCSSTCGIAVKTRTRTCPKLPCLNGITEETASCHLPSCGPYIQQKCFLEDSNITFLDLGHNHMNQDLKPVWKIADTGRSLTETLNTRPSVGLSNLGDVTEPVSFSGRVFSASGDDDVIGIVFGFWNEANFFVIASARQHPGPTNWYVARLHASCGSSCAATTTISDAIWDPQSHPEDITVLATGSTYWQHGNQYNFTVSFNPADLLLSASVTNENQVDSILKTGIISAKTNQSGVDAVSRKGGFVGVYVDSQAHTTWDYLVCQDSHFIAPIKSCSVGEEYDGNCYIKEETPMTWLDAEDDCNKRNGTLASIDNAEANNFVATLAGEHTAWIGASDTETEGSWKWTNGDNVLFTNWYNGQPDNWSRKQHCAAINYLQFGKWDDDQCGIGSLHPFICQGRFLSKVNSGPVLIHTDTDFKYYKVPVPDSSNMTSATVLSTCSAHGMKPQCFDGREGYRYNDNNCVRVDECSTHCAYTLSNILCSTKNPRNCKSTMNMFWYMDNWASGSACGVTTRGGFCSTGKDYTSTSDTQYFVACIKTNQDPFLIHTDSNFKYYKVPVPDSSIMTSPTVLDACTAHGMKPQCVNGKEGYNFNDNNCVRVEECKNYTLGYCPFVLSDILCSTNDPKNCTTTLNMFYYMYNWGSGSACGVTTKQFCSYGKDYTSTSDTKYFAACIKTNQGQQQRQQNYPGKRQQQFPKLSELEGSNVPGLPKQLEQESSNIPSSQKISILNLPEILEEEAPKIPSLPKEPNQGNPKEASLPLQPEQEDLFILSLPGQHNEEAPKLQSLTEQSGMKLKFQLKGKIGMEKVKISVDGNEEEINLTTEWRLFSYPRPSTGSFSVEFLNDIGYTDVFIRGHESQVTDLLPIFPANKFLGCGTENEDEKCGYLRQGTLMWNGKYTYTLKG